jgi:hypothetical protein
MLIQSGNILGEWVGCSFPVAVAVAVSRDRRHLNERRVVAVPLVETKPPFVFVETYCNTENATKPRRTLRHSGA